MPRQTLKIARPRSLWWGIRAQAPRLKGLIMRKELIKISEYQRRRWGENGTPLCSQAIRNYIRNGKLPGEQIGSLWYVDWNALNIADGNDLVAMVLRGVA